MLRSEIRARNPFLAQNMCDANFRVRDASRAGLCAITAVAPRLQPGRDELGWRAKRLWRKHRGREVENEKMVGTILLGDRNPSPCQAHGASPEDQTFQD